MKSPVLRTLDHHTALRQAYDQRTRSVIDSETGDRLKSYSVGNGSIAFTWVNSEGNDTARRPTLEECALFPQPHGWTLQTGSNGFPELIQYSPSVL